MLKRLTRVAPLQLGKVLAVLYGCISLPFVPILLVISAVAPKNANGVAAIPLVLAVLMPIFYTVLGFIGGVIAAAVYNLVAGWTGGIEFTIEDAPPALGAGSERLS